MFSGYVIERDLGDSSSRRWKQSDGNHQDGDWLASKESLEGRKEY